MSHEHLSCRVGIVGTSIVVASVGVGAAMTPVRKQEAAVAGARCSCRGLSCGELPVGLTNLTSLEYAEDGKFWRWGMTAACTC